MTDYIGKWNFHSIGMIDENNKLVYLNAKEYIDAPIPYIDETNEEEVAHEKREREQMSGMVLKVCEDGKILILTPLPKDVSQEKIDQAAADGTITLLDGMMVGDHPMTWEVRDGEFWYDSGIEGEVFGEKTDGWTKGLDENGFLNFMAMRFSKND